MWFLICPVSFNLGYCSEYQGNFREEGVCQNSEHDSWLTVTSVLLGHPKGTWVSDLMKFGLNR